MVREGLALLTIRRTCSVPHRMAGYRRGMITPEIRPRGFFLFGNNPWLLVILLIIVIALIVYMQRKR